MDSGRGGAFNSCTWQCHFIHNITRSSPPATFICTYSTIYDVLFEFILQPIEQALRLQAVWLPKNAEQYARIPMPVITSPGRPLVPALPGYHYTYTQSTNHTILPVSTGAPSVHVFCTAIERQVDIFPGPCCKFYRYRDKDSHQSILCDIVGYD